MMIKLPLMMMMMIMSLMTRKTTAKRVVVVDPVTSGALTFLVLAASLVTLSFLMAPVIERVFGRTSLPENLPANLPANLPENLPANLPANLPVLFLMLPFIKISRTLENQQVCKTDHLCTVSPFELWPDYKYSIMDCTVINRITVSVHRHTSPLILPQQIHIQRDI
jgi:hypothetical protein